MAYPDKLLADDERVVEHLHPHWITLVPATFWFLIICALTGIGIGFAPWHGTAHTVFIIVIIVVALALLVKLTFIPWLSVRTTHYVFTTYRVLIRRGILRHTGRDIALQRINDVAFTQSLWDRIVGAGTLTIESAGEHGQENLHNLPHSDRMQQLLNRLIEEDHDRRAAVGRGYLPGPAAAPGGYDPQQGYPTAGYPPPQEYPAGPGYPPGAPGEAGQQGYPQGQQGYPQGQQGYPQGGYPPGYPPQQR